MVGYPFRPAIGHELPYWVISGSSISYYSQLQQYTLLYRPKKILYQEVRIKKFCTIRDPHLSVRSSNLKIQLYLHTKAHDASSLHPPIPLTFPTLTATLPIPTHPTMHRKPPSPSSDDLSSLHPTYKPIYDDLNRKVILPLQQRDVKGYLTYQQEQALDDFQDEMEAFRQGKVKAEQLYRSLDAKGLRGLLSEGEP